MRRRTGFPDRAYWKRDRPNVVPARADLAAWCISTVRIAWATCDCRLETSWRSFEETETDNTAFASTINGGSVSAGVMVMRTMSRSPTITRRRGRLPHPASDFPVSARERHQRFGSSHQRNRAWQTCRQCGHSVAVGPILRCFRSALAESAGSIRPGDRERSTRQSPGTRSHRTTCCLRPGLPTMIWTAGHDGAGQPEGETDASARCRSQEETDR